MSKFRKRSYVHNISTQLDKVSNALCAEIMTRLNVYNNSNIVVYV